MDVFGHEYGYTPKETLNMTYIGAFLLLQRISKRYNTKDQPKGNMSMSELKNKLGG